MAISLATGRKLIDEHVFERARVLLVCFEDGKDELRRRLTAMMLHYGITKADVVGYLFVSTVSRADAKLASSGPGGKVVAGKLGGALDRAITRRKADVVFLDPLVKTHAIDENNNTAVDFVAGQLSHLSEKHDCGVCSPHHNRKGQADAGNVDTGRGAGALKDAYRLCYTLTSMQKAEAHLFGISDDERAFLFGVDAAKVNLVPRPTDARWFKLVNVPLGNATEVHPKGDEIQTVGRWFPPDLFAGFFIVTANRILDLVDAGLPDGQRYSDNNAAKKRAAWKVVTNELPDKTEAQARSIINTWVKNGVLFLEEYTNPDNRHAGMGLRLNQGNRPGELR
jgi:AAA domain